MKFTQYVYVGLASAVLLLGVTGCNKDDTSSAVKSDAKATSRASDEAAPIERKADFAQIARGGQIFEKNCAVCHGAQGQGAVNWRMRTPDGKFPPPPLNGTGHAWHHPLAALRYVIKNGSPGGQGNMPAWKDKLTDQQIDDVIAWFQSKWPDRVYQVWAQNDQRSRVRQK